MPNTLRLCRDCEHFQPNAGGIGGPLCERLSYISLVTGATMLPPCSESRASFSECGPDGKLFVPRLVAIEGDATVGATALSG